MMKFNFDFLQQQIIVLGVAPKHTPPFLLPWSMQDLLHVGPSMHFPEHFSPGGTTGPKQVAKPTTKMKLKNAICFAKIKIKNE